jgi:hypothetical protein
MAEHEVREESDEFEQGTATAANPARELTTEGSGESAGGRGSACVLKRDKEMLEEIRPN